MADEIAIAKYRRLVMSLYKRTEESSMDWEASIIMEGYDAFVGEKVINLTMISNGSSAPDYQINILNRTDYSIVDTFKDVDIHEDVVGNLYGYPTYYRLMEALYNIIKRRVSGADAAIDALLKDLEL